MCTSPQATGDIYSGTWSIGRKSGQGVYQFGADESVMNGTWVDGAITEGKWGFKVSQQRKEINYGCRIKWLAPTTNPNPPRRKTVVAKISGQLVEN